MKLEIGLTAVAHFCLQICSGNYTGTCKGKLGTYTRDYFVLDSCAWCFLFLFPQKQLFPTEGGYLTVTSNKTTNELGKSYRADVWNKTSRDSICSYLYEDECDMWTMCCNAARACCDNQIKTGRDVKNSTCKATWDGFACWDGGTAGSNSFLPCPSFLKFSIPTRYAVKTCRQDGTWLTKGGSEWTDYTSCLSYQDLRITLFIGLGCQVASLALLVPSVIIFINYKFLRRQHRIRIHINFFLSFIMSNIMFILWNMLVTYDKITNTQLRTTFLHQNLAVCKLMSFLKLYFTSTNYAWMFCEGIYLYRLISNAFSPPKRLLPLYIFGWGFPFTYCSVYAIIRLVIANESCWAISLGRKEWIIYAPNLSCLILNIFFLCSILRILLTQLQAHPNEPSSFRRALKATFVLIPLFGIQLAVTIYRLPPDSALSVHYERVSEVISNSQGFVVALIFCIFNGEVSTQIKRTWRHHLDKMAGSRRLNTTLSLHFNNSETQRARHTASRRNSMEPCLLDSTSGSTLHSKQSEPL